MSAQQFDIEAGIRLDGEKEFKSAVTQVNAELRNLKSQSSLLKETFAGQANTLEALRAKHEVLGKTLDAQNRKVDATKVGLEHARESYAKVGLELEILKGKYEAAKKKMEDMGKSSGTSKEELENQKKEVAALAEAIEKGKENFDSAGKSIDKWKTDLNRAEAQTIKANRELEQNAGYMKEAEKATDKCATSIDGYGKKVKQAGDNSESMGKYTKESLETMASALVAAGVAKGAKEIAEALYECVGAAEEFGVSTAKLSTIADTASVSMEKLTSDAMELSNNAGVAASSITESAYQAISASVSTENAVGMVNKANKLAVGGFADVETSIDVLTTVVNAYGLGIEKVDSVSDMLVKTQDLGKTSVGDLGSSMGKVIPIAAAYGVEMDSLCTMYAIQTANGIKTAESTTYIKAMLQELGKSSSKVAKVLQEETGKSFSQLMEEGNTVNDVLQVLAESCNGDVTAFSNLWSSIQAGLGSLSLFNAGGNKFNEVLGKMQDSMGATEENYKKMTDTAEFSKQKMANSIQNLKIAIGQQLVPAFNDMYKAGSKGFEWATEFVKNNPWLVSAITGLTAALATLATGIAAVMIVKKATELMGVFNLVLAANPAILVATAIAGLVVALGTLAANTEQTKTKTDELVESSTSLKEETDKLTESVQASAESWQDSAAGMEAQGTHVKNLSDELFGLAEKENLTNGEKYRMAGIVEQLNSLIPELGLAINEETGELTLNRQEIEKSIEANMAYSKAKAAQEHLTEIARQQAEVEVEKIKIEAAQGKIKDELIRLEGEHRRVLEESTDGLIEYNGAMQRNDFVLGEIADESYRLTEEQKKLNKSTEDLDKELENLAGEYGTVYEYAEDQKKQAGEVAEAYDEAAGSVNNLINEEQLLAQTEYAKEIQEKYEKLKESIENSISAIIGVYDKFDGGEKIAADKMLKNLESQRAGLENWKENITRLSGQAGNGMSEEFLRYLIDLGPKGANAVQALVNELDKENGKFKEIAEAYAENLNLEEAVAESGASAVRALEGQLDEMSATADSKSAGVNDSLGKIGADEPYAALKHSFDDAMQHIVDSGGAFSTEIDARFRQAVIIAQEHGVEIPAQLAAGLQRGLMGPEQAVAEINRLIDTKQKELGSSSKDAGTESAQSMGDGISANKGAVTSAASDIVDSAANKAHASAGQFRNAGNDMAQGMASGILGGGPLVANATADIVRQGIQAAKKEAQINSPSRKYKDEIGKMLSYGTAEGITDGAGKVRESTASMCRSTLETAKKELGIHSPSVKFKKDVGKQISNGVAFGIKEGTGKAKKSAEQLSKEVSVAATGWLKSYKLKNKVSLEDEKYFWTEVRKELKKGTREYEAATKKINSLATSIRASKEVKEIGKMITNGVAQGIAIHRLNPAKATEEMTREIYKAAKKELTSMKKLKDVSLSGEKLYWQEVRSLMKKGTKEYEEATLKIEAAARKIRSSNFAARVSAKGNFGVGTKEKDTVDSNGNVTKEGAVKSAAKYSKDVLAAATSWMSEYKKQHGVTADGEVAFWQQIQKQLGKGTAAYKEAAQNIKAAQKKVLQERLNAAEAELSKRKVYKKVSEKDEMDYWDVVRKQFKKGTGERIEADRKYYEAKKGYDTALKKAEQDRLSASGKALSQYKTYYKASAKAETEYWDIVRKQFKKGTDERIEADQEYYEAKETLNSQLKALNDDYVQNCKGVQDKLKEDIQSLTDAYNDAVKDRAQSIYSSFGLFDEFKSETENGEKLLYNLKTQVAGIADWELQLQELTSRGLPTGLMEELQEMGPEASASLHALNSLTDAQLKEYTQLWQQKHSLADSQAAKELEPMRKETEIQIKALAATAQKELGSLKKEYDAAVKDLNASISSALKAVAKSTKKVGEDATAALINGIKSGATKKDAKVKLKSAADTIASGMSSLPSAGKTIGKDTLMGIVNGLNDTKQLSKSAKTFVENLKKEIQKAAQIKSPSRLFKKEVGLHIPSGVGEGIEEGTEKATKAGTSMIARMMEQSKAKMAESRAALSTYAGTLNAGAGIEALNNLTQAAPVQQSAAAMDNSVLLAAVQAMAEMMQEYFPKIGNAQIVMDTGALVGETAGGIGTELNMMGRRMRR